MTVKFCSLCIRSPVVMHNSHPIAFVRPLSNALGQRFPLEAVELFTCTLPQEVRGARAVPEAPPSPPPLKT